MPWTKTEPGIRPAMAVDIDTAEAVHPNAVGLDGKMKWLLPTVIATVVAIAVAAGFIVTPIAKVAICVNSIAPVQKHFCTEAAENKWLPLHLRMEALRTVAVSEATDGTATNAITAYERLEKEGPLTATDFHTRAGLFFDLKKYQESAKDYAAELALSPDDDYALENLVWSQIQAGDYAAAQKSAAKFLVSHPDSIVGHVEAARAAYYDARNEIAQFHVSLAIEKDKNNSVAHNLKGLIYEDQSEYARAIASYSRAIELSPADAVMWTNRARAHRYNGDPNAAIADITIALAHEPSAERYIELASAQTDADNFSFAKFAVDKAIAEDSKSAAAYATLARLQFYQEDYAASRTSANTALAIDKDFTRAKFRLALLDGKDGQHEKALAGLRALEQDWPNSLDLYLNIGEELLELDRPDDALKAFDRAFEIYPKESEVFDGRARAFISLRKWQSVIENSDKAIALAPKIGSYYARRAYAHWALDNIESAQRDYDSAIANSPKRMWVSDERLYFMSVAGEIKAAEAEVTALMAKPAPTAGVLRAAGHLADRRGQSSEAVTYYGKALALSPDDAWLLEDMAWASIDNSQPAAALDYCNKMIVLKPNAGESYFCRARALRSMDKQKEALADVDKALALDRGYKSARYERASLAVNLENYEGAINDCQILITSSYRVANCHYYIGFAQRKLGNLRAAAKSFETALLTADGDLAKDVNIELQSLRGLMPQSEQSKLRWYPQVRRSGANGNTLPPP